MQAEANDRAAALEQSAVKLRAAGLAARADELEAEAVRERKRAESAELSPGKRHDSLKRWLERAEGRLRRATEEEEDAEGALKDARRAREKLQEELDEGKLKLEELRKELSEEKDDEGDAVLSDASAPPAQQAPEVQELQMLLHLAQRAAAQAGEDAKSAKAAQAEQAEELETFRKEQARRWQKGAERSCSHWASTRCRSSWTRPSKSTSPRWAATSGLQRSASPSAPRRSRKRATMPTSGPSASTWAEERYWCGAGRVVAASSCPAEGP